MPVNNYRCNNCGYLFEELWMSFQEAEENEPNFLEQVECPKCKTKSKTKQIGSPSVEFKGEGWTNKHIGPSSGERRDSTGSLREQSVRLKEQMKNLTTKDLYGDI